MASIWTQGLNSPPQKVRGHIPARPDIVRAKLTDAAGRLAKRNSAKIVLDEPFEIHLAWPDGKVFAVWAEFYSPPSAPEEGQPHKGKACVVVKDGTTHPIGAAS